MLQRMPAPDIDTYIAALPEPAAGILSQLRTTIHAAVPDITEAISYAIPAYRYKGTYLVYTAAWKRHVGLYPIFDDTTLEAELAPYRAEKNSLHFNYSEPIPYDLVTRIVIERARSIDSSR
jgi:uncharacterized protein YdhG (YjbR/CyaY superfamily)